MRLAVVGVVLVAALAFLGLIGYALAQQTGFASSSVAPSSAGATRVFGTGQLLQLEPYAAKDFSLTLFAGGTWQLSAHKGTPILVNFWASWCPPCKQEMPVVQAGWTRWHTQVTFLGIDVWDTPADAAAFLKQYGATYANGDDPAGHIAIDYGLTGVPETFIIDASGRVVQHYIGPLDASALAALVTSVAAQP